MRQLVGMLIGALAWITGVSAILAAVLVLHIAIPWKLVIVGFGVLLCLLLAQFGALGERLAQLLYFIRCLYISVEYQRLKPEDRTPAKDILGVDVEREKDNDHLNYEPGGRSLPSIIIWIVYAIGVAFTTFVIYETLRSG